jgi:hypothetical protein
LPATPTRTGFRGVYDANLFSIRGKLYANFGTSTINFETGTVTPVIPDALYQIDPRTGHATLIAPTDTGLSSIVNVNDTIYAFRAATGQVVTLDVTTGLTRVVSDLDPDAGVIAGSSPARPDPKSGH